MRLIAPISRVSIADYVFFSGDGQLMPDIEIDLGENQRSSSCRFSINDPGLKIGAEFQKMSIEQGGILAPDELINAPNDSKPEPTSGGAAEPGTTQASGGGNREENIKLLVAECLRQGVTDRRQIAYVLGTVEKECHFEPVSEYGGASKWYAPYYGRGFVQITHKENYQKYSKILGRDFVKDMEAVKEPTVAAFICVHGMKNGIFTGLKLSDYINGSKKDFVGARKIVNPDEPGAATAAYAEQWEKNLDKYLSNSSMAANSKPAETGEKSGSTTNPTTTQKIETTTPIVESSIKGTEIIIELGYSSTKKLISFHFIHTGTVSKRDKGEITTFEGRSIRWLLTRVPQTTSYTDVSLRQISEMVARSYGLKLQMEGVGVNYHHLDQTAMTPFQLLQREAKKIGYRLTDDRGTLLLEPEGRPKFRNFVIDEETLISISFADQARGSKPIPFQAIADAYTAVNEAKFVVDRQTGKVEQLKPESFVGTPAASKDQSPGAVTGGAATPVSGTPAPTTAPNQPNAPAPSPPRAMPHRGFDDQFKYEVKTDNSESKDANGKPVKREVKNETSTKRGVIIAAETISETRQVNGEEVKLTTKTVTTKEIIFEFAGDPPGRALGQRTTIEKDLNGTKSTTTTQTTEIDADLKATLDEKTTTPEAGATENYGLPKQIPGALDLADGRAEAQVISDEAKRIRGYESTAVLVTTEEVLQIVPGEIIGISGAIFPEPFNREWRVFRVNHQWGMHQTQITFYTPQGLKEESAGSSPSTPTESTPIANTPSGKLLNPMPNTARGTPFDPGGAIRGRPHTGIDLAEHAPPQKILASANGVVSKASWQGGFGNAIEIQHDGEWQGWDTFYAHLQAMYVKVGDKVTRGQVIGLEGSTGNSFGKHLHFEVRKGGQLVDPEPLLSPCPIDVYGEGANVPLRCKK